MKLVLPVFLLFTFSAHSQDSLRMAFRLKDTASHTVIESAIRQNGVMQKVEYLNSEYIGGVYFYMIIVQNLKTKEKTKGVYVSNQQIASIYVSRFEHHAYIDAAEMNEVVDFFEQCNNNWKTASAVGATSYEYETAGNLRFRFTANSNSSAWRFSFQFDNYYFQNEETMGKGKSEKLLTTLKKFRDDLNAY
jgi:hypothetical protein